MESQIDLDGLFAAVEELSTSTGGSPDAFLLDHGLRVHRALERWTYSSTPVNTTTFASTGGDGVHFGFLQGTTTTERDGPVVMTVPAATHRNHVVAGSIGEFLGLGCIHGWFSLEQLAYRPKYALELYKHAAQPREVRISQLFARLSLGPVALKPKRLKELARQHHGAIVLPKDEPARKPADLEAFLAWKRSKWG